MDQKKIVELQPGENVTSFFVLRKKDMKAKVHSDEFYLSLELGDATGRIKSTLWDDVQTVNSELAVGDVVKVKAKVTTYKGRNQLTIEKIRKVKDGDEVDFKMLLPSVDKRLSDLFSHLDELVASIENPHLNDLCSHIFNDAEIRTAFGQAPGGKLWHHNYLGGLLEHTLSVTDIAADIGEKYPGVKRDLLLAAGLLHDLGKIHSYTYKTMFDFTDEGRLIGHIVIGAQMVTDRIKNIEGFPAQLEKELIHLILSHQGKLEHASPVVPMTLEGLILYYADEIDSKANAFLRIKKKEKRPGVKWSSYVNLLNQYYYFGDNNEE